MACKNFSSIFALGFVVFTSQTFEIRRNSDIRSTHLVWQQNRRRDLCIGWLL